MIVVFSLKAFSAFHNIWDHYMSCINIKWKFLSGSISLIWTELDCTYCVVHNITLPYNALDTALPSTEVINFRACSALQSFTALPWTLQWLTALHCNESLQFTELQCLTALHCSDSLHCSALIHCTALNLSVRTALDVACCLQEAGTSFRLYRRKSFWVPA